MQVRILTRFIGILIFFLGIAMIPPFLVSLFYRETCALPLLVSVAVSSLSGVLVFACFRGGAAGHLNHRDGVAVVTVGWLMAGLVGTLPYLFSGAIPDITRAYFESVSGFTTTGASILDDIEGLPKGLLLWRSQTQWLGGMGIIVLSIAILPFLGIGGMQLYKAEIPSPVVDKLKPRISETAKTLWKVYVFITGLEVCLLTAGGMPLFDAICHAFGTLPTGGFSTMNASIAHYNNMYFEGVITLFMLLAGVNFSLHYRLLNGDLRVFGRDSECRTFFLLFLVFALIIGWDVYGAGHASFGEAFRQAAFQVSSILTTTGFVTADYDAWSSLSRIILLICMFLGAMAGSTGGGIKTMRILLLIRHSYPVSYKHLRAHET